MDFNKQLKITDPMCFFYRTPYLEIIERMIDKGDRAPRTMFSLDISRLIISNRKVGPLVEPFFHSEVWKFAVLFHEYDFIRRI